jgi:hypothetical protein
MRFYGCITALNSRCYSLTSATIDIPSNRQSIAEILLMFFAWPRRCLQHLLSDVFQRRPPVSAVLLFATDETFVQRDS